MYKWDFEVWVLHGLISVAFALTAAIKCMFVSLAKKNAVI